MIISKKKFERLVEERVCEIMRERERERFADERHYELEKRIDTETHNIWRQIRLLTGRLDKIEGRDEITATALDDPFIP